MNQTEPSVLIHGHTPALFLLAREYARRFRCDPDDAAGYGASGLISAAMNFDPSRGFAFATYAAHKIRGAMRDGFRAEVGKSKVQPKFERMDSAPTAPARGDPVAEDEGWRVLTADMSRRDRAILILRYRQGLTFAEIGIALGDSEVSARVRHRNLLRRLRGMAQREDGRLFIEECLAA